MSISLKDQVAKMVGEGEELNPPEVSQIRYEQIMKLSNFNGISQINHIE